MRIEYTPVGQDKASVWFFNRNKIMSKRAEQIEKTYGDTFDQFNVGLVRGMMRARRVLLWHLISLEHPGMPFKTLDDFSADQLVIRFEYRELDDMRESVLKDKRLDDDERAAMAEYLHGEYLSALRLELGLDKDDESMDEAELLDAVEARDGTGKARTASDGGATS